MRTGDITALIVAVAALVSAVAALLHSRATRRRFLPNRTPRPKP